MKIDFSLILACYCEEPHLFANVLKLKEFLSATRFSFELIFVEDKSPDNTVREVKRCVEFLEKAGVSVKTIFHEKNQGRGASVQDGFRIASGDFIGFIDVDLEHLMDPMIPMLLMLKSNACDAVVLNRVEDVGARSAVRTIIANTYRWLVHLVLELPVADTEAGLKIFKREKILPVLDQVKDKGWFWDTEIVHRSHLNGLRVCEHFGVFHQNRNKKSTVRVFHDSWVYFLTLVSYAWKMRRPRV